MHVALLTVLIVAGAGQPAYAPADQPSVVAGDPGAAPCEMCQGECAEAGKCKKQKRSYLCDWFGPMPQTCYSPRFGCYPGNGRDIQRYPAFHGYYYREPYNYRHYFDYPWHASPRDPMGYFGCQSEAPGEVMVTPTADPAIAPAPTPAPAVPPPPIPGGPQAKLQRFSEPRLLAR